MFKRYLKNEKGLTLIELLVVIVILGIIAAIAIPAIGNLISNSEDKAAVAEAIQIIDGAKLYVASESIALPATGSTTITKANLDPYVDKAEGTFTVQLSSSGEYSITGHEGSKVVKNSTASTASATEDELIAWTP